MLRTAQYAWQQAALSDNARAVFDLGRELYERITGLGKHVDSLGKALTGAVSAYNQSVGTLENRVLVSARKLNQLGVVEAGLEPPRLVDESTRALSAPELTGGIRPGTRGRPRSRPGRPAGRPATARAARGQRGRLSTAIRRPESGMLGSGGAAVPQHTRHVRPWPAQLPENQRPENQRPGLTDGLRPARRPGRGLPGGPQESPSRLTARGAGLAMFSVFFPGTLTAGWLHLTALTGLSFVAGCLLAGLYTRRAHLLIVVTMPPMIFMAALICAKAVSATGNTLVSTAEGSLITLSAIAPWLFYGTAATIVIALFRGLPRRIGELRAELRGDPGRGNLDRGYFGRGDPGRGGPHRGGADRDALAAPGPGPETPGC